MEQLGQFIVNHWPLWVALAIIVVLILLHEAQNKKAKAKELSPSMAIHLINHDNALVFDLRDKELYKKGHIIDAQSASIDDFEQGKMDKHKEKALILVCARGLQSAALAAKLRNQGFTTPMVLNGGMESWLQADLPVVKGKG